MIKSIAAVVALVSLAACLVVPVWYFQGEYSFDTYKTRFLVASIGWFGAAVVYDVRRGRERRSAE